MALELRESCERCDAALPHDAEAFICSYECTFCSVCTTAMARDLPELRRRAGATAATDRRVSRAVVLAAVRTPVGRYGGSLAGVRPDDLAGIAVAAAVERAGVDPGEIEDVYLGCANQAGEDNRNVARMAALLAGLPESVAGVTVNRLCASGLSAVIGACHAIAAGDGDSSSPAASSR